MDHLELYHNLHVIICSYAMSNKYINKVMNKIVGALIVVVIAFAGYFLWKNTNTTSQDTEKMTTESEVLSTVGPVKEVSTTAYYDETGVWYSLKEIRVKKGDTVRIKATNTKGMHDLTIDEFGVKKELPLNEEVTIEFVADKTGEFVYYCSKPGHRAKGQWGNLIVE